MLNHLNVTLRSRTRSAGSQGIVQHYLFNAFAATAIRLRIIIIPKSQSNSFHSSSMPLWKISVEDVCWFVSGIVAIMLYHFLGMT